jgi:hypothetical protein
MTKSQQNAVSSNLTSICTTANPSPLSIPCTDYAATNMAANRLCGRILRRLLYVLFYGTTWAKEDGHYIRRNIRLRNVSTVLLLFRGSHAQYSLQHSLYCSQSSTRYDLRWTTFDGSRCRWTCSSITDLYVGDSSACHPRSSDWIVCQSSALSRLSLNCEVMCL